MEAKLKLLKACVLVLCATLFGLRAVSGSDSLRILEPGAVIAVEILPQNVTLEGPRGEHRIVIEAALANGQDRDVTGIARLESSDPRVATVTSDGIVKAVSDGEAMILAEVGGQKVVAPVKVSNTNAPAVWSFRNHVLPVMTKMGCNSGACHGAAAGKNGFKLTLRGYDPEVDYFTLTRQAGGRRINKLEPAESLMLLKPTAAIPHGGGKRFGVDSLEYTILSEWIANGIKPPLESDPQIERLEVLPSQATLALGGEQQLLVRAHFSDRRIEDVTRWVKYSSADETVATVGEGGRVKMQGHGEAAITLWYLSRVAFARVGVPFPNEVKPQAYSAMARNNFVDGLVLAKLKQLNIAPSEGCSDAEFLRRAYLDAAGIQPSAEEVERFLADRSPNKRARLVDALLERPEFVDYWTYKWSDVLLVSTRKLSSKNMRSFYNWVRQSVAANKPWSELVRELTVASGNSQEYGPVNYYLIHRNTIDLAENFTRAFMGLSITCARCHNHPLEKWTQKEYYGFANLFSRVTSKTGTGPSEITVFSSPAGEINHPRLGRPLPPKPLDAPAIPPDSTEDRREYLARWLTSPSNSNFARALVNRVWENFMGRGLVHPVDDLRATNPPSNEELLAALTEEFVKNGFDVKRLTRTIMNSATYQLSSRTNETNARDDRYYSHYLVRRLPAEVILDAMSQVTGAPESFPGYPPGTRAMQLPDTRVNSYFLTVFGRPERVNTSAAERMQDPSLTQALHAINGSTLNKKLMAADNVIGRLMKANVGDRAIVDTFYLSTFSRYPTDGERAQLLDALSKAATKGEERRQVLEDLLWAMLTSKEFLFNH
jgi:hypothetical protein